MPTPNRDVEHLAKLRDYYAETRRIPTQQRIADLIGFSKPAARKLLDRLVSEGFITRTPDGRLAGMPWLGYASIGFFGLTVLFAAALRAAAPHVATPGVNTPVTPDPSNAAA